MSDITRRITTVWAAQGGNVRAVMGSIRSSMQQMERQNYSTGRSQGFLNDQLRAFGTTIRYAFAGTAIFGGLSQIAKLSEFQRQLGLISAIGTTAGGQGGQGLPLVGQRLQEIGAQARDASVEVVQPVSQINDAIINLLSTVSNVPENQIVPMVSEISKAATLAQVSAEDATKAFTTMNVAAGKAVNLRNVSSVAQEFFMLTKRAPGGPAAGQQIIGQLGVLANAGRFGQFTTAQVMALLTSTLRTGLTPAQAGRSLAYTLQGVNPLFARTKTAQTALASVGISTTTFPQMGGLQALIHLFTRVRQLGGAGISAQTNARLANLQDETGDAGPVPKALITGAGGRLLRQTFPQIYAFRAAVALYTRFVAQNTSQTPNLLQEIKDFTQASQGHVSQLEDLNKAWKRFTDQAQLPKAAIALQNLGLDIANAFQPILNPAARAVIKARGFESKHTNEIVLGGLATLAAVFIGKRAGLGGLLTGGLALKNLGGTRDPQTGQLFPGTTPTNPLFVVVVSQWFGPGSRGALIPTPGTPGEKVPPGGIRGRLSTLGRTAARVSLWGAALIAADEYAKQHLPKEAPARTQLSFLSSLGNLEKRVVTAGPRFVWHSLFGGGGRSSADMRRIQGPVVPGQITGLGGNWAATPLGRMGIPDPATNYKAYAAAMTSRGMIPATAGQVNRAVQVYGKASVDVNVTVKQPDGSKQLQKAHVPLTLSPRFTIPQKAPQTRGQDKTNRGL